MIGLKEPDFLNTLVVSNASNRDIITVIHKSLPEAIKQVSPIASRFAGNGLEETARNVWRFLRDQVNYQKDPEDKQMIRMPARLVSDGAGDCKSFSLFAASVLSALGYRVGFKYVSYGLNPTPSHVYVVAEAENRRVIVDGVYDQFNKEKKPTFKFIEWMDVYSLSGISGKRNKFKKIALAPARRAFRTIVALNVRNIAVKLDEAIRKDANAVYNKWKRLGGHPNNLMESVNIGRKKKPIFGSESINGVPVVVAAMAAAAPILVAMSSIIKSVKGGEDSQLNDIVDASGEAIKQLGGDVNTYAVDPTAAPSKFDLQADGLSFKPSTGLLIGGGLLFAYLIFKKK